MPVPSTCWFLSGPTAAGKTEVGVALAERIGAEIVSMDSMALYRGMDIGTAKPTASQRQIVPHHLVDILAPHEDFSLAQYLEAAQRCVAEIQGRGREVLFVGGTPLYMKGLLCGIFEGPAADWEFRRGLEAQARQEAPGWLHRRLTAVDPAAATRLHANDTRRLIRALEVFEKTGQPISGLQAQFRRAGEARAGRLFVLDWPKAELHERIDRRVEGMFARGLVDEVRRLLARPRPLSRTAGQAVGYAEVIEHLSGRHGLPETIELVRTHTRQLAKRQGTWFRSLGECRFVPVSVGSGAEEIAAGIASSRSGRLPLE
jgi:tRNA dimethylallyltransferase